MRTHNFLLLAAALLCSCSTTKTQLSQKPEAPASKPLEIEATKTVPVGSIEVMDFEAMMAPNPLVGNKTILEVQMGANPRQFNLIFLKRGSTSVLFYDQQGKLVSNTIYQVISNELNKLVLSIRRLLKNVEGISVEAVDDKVVIDGALKNPRDLDRILQVQEAYKQVVLNLVTISPLVYEERAKLMQSEIADDPGAANVAVRYVNGTYFLLGQVDFQADSDRAEVIVQTWLPEIMGSPAIRENVLTLGAKKYSIRNLLYVKERSPGRMPSSNP